MLIHGDGKGGTSVCTNYLLTAVWGGIIRDEGVEYSVGPEVTLFLC